LRLRRLERRPARAPDPVVHAPRRHRELRSPRGRRARHHLAGAHDAGQPLPPPGRLRNSVNVMRVRLAILGLLGLALAACGDAGSGDDGGGKGLDAWELTLHVSPAQSTYLPGELVKVELEIRDDRGVLVVTPLPTVWSAVGAKAEGEGAFRLESSENLATITACLEGEGAPCVTAELPVDRSPPTLVVERPAPGDHL